MHCISHIYNKVYMFIVKMLFINLYNLCIGEYMQTKKELLGLRIKEFRENRKLTQDKLSEMVGIDPKHLSRIENGRNYPSFETLEKILESLDISYEDIFNFNHLVSKVELLNKISEKLNNLSEDKLRFIYKIINEL